MEHHLQPRKDDQRSDRPSTLSKAERADCRGFLEAYPLEAPNKKSHVTLKKMQDLELRIFKLIWVCLKIGLIFPMK